MHPSIAGVHAEVRARDVARAAANPHHHHVHGLAVSRAARSTPRLRRSLPADARERAGWALIRLGLRFVDAPGHLPSAR